jgi:glutathionylspermidine synthase
MKNINKIKINPLSNKQLEEIGLHWHTDTDGSSYIADEIVVITQDEADAYYKAGNEVYDMFIKAGEYVVENDLLHEIGIPFNLIDIVKMSWENDVHWHIYGRFDFAGGINGSAIKLLEFNADTPTALYESAIIQWALLKANNMEENIQFNDITKAISDNFKRLITLSEDISDFEEKYPDYAILFSSIEGNDEEEMTTKFLQTCARDAGFRNEFCFLDKVQFNEEDGVLDENNNSYEYWFKLFPWEDIAIEEGDLALILTQIIQDQKTIILNPAYTLMFQSKAMLKIIYDLFPDSPYLLETSYQPLENKKYIEKKVFGREGDNSTIYNADGSVLHSKDGEYGHYKSIYQEFVELNQDEKDLYYQAGVFFAYESCGVGFRRGGVILDNMSKFVGHILK